MESDKYEIVYPDSLRHTMNQQGMFYICCLVTSANLKRFANRDILDSGYEPQQLILCICHIQIRKNSINQSCKTAGYRKECCQRLVLVARCR